MPSVATGFDRSGLVAIVTGGARGLGRAMSLGLLRNGFRVVVAHLSTSSSAMHELEAIVVQEGSQSRLFAVDCDVTN